MDRIGSHTKGTTTHGEAIESCFRKLLPGRTIHPAAHGLSRLYPDSSPARTGDQNCWPASGFALRSRPRPRSARWLDSNPAEPGIIRLHVRIGLAHAQFETIHPFLDGNGRVGRLLITFLLCEQQVLLKPVLYLSHYFKRHRTEYYEHLQATRERGAWEDWLEFFLRGITEVSREATETARRILALREQHRSIITDQLGRAAGNGHRVLETLYERPILAVKDVQTLTGTTHQAASSLVAKMTEHGILREVTEYKRNRLFCYLAYINLFSEPEPADGAL